MFEHMPNARIVDAVLPIAQNLFRGHGLTDYSHHIQFIRSSLLATPVTFLYHTLFVYEKKLREKSNYRQSLIIGLIGTFNAQSNHSFVFAILGNIYHMRKMEWCFSSHFTSYIENHLRLDNERRQLPPPVFNSRYAIELLQKLVDDILFSLVDFEISFSLFQLKFLFSLTPLHLSMKRIPINTTSIGVTMNLPIHLCN